MYYLDYLHDLYHIATISACITCITCSLCLNWIYWKSEKVGFTHSVTDNLKSNFQNGDKHGPIKLRIALLKSVIIKEK